MLALNVLLAVRGVKIWQLITTLRVEQWIREVIPQMPFATRAVKVANWATLPLRLPFRPLVALHRRQVQMQMQMAAERLAALERAKASATTTAFLARKANEIGHHVVAPMSGVAAYSWRQIGTAAATLGVLTRPSRAAA